MFAAARVGDVALIFEPGNEWNLFCQISTRHTLARRGRGSPRIPSLFICHALDGRDAARRELVQCPKSKVKSRKTNTSALSAFEFERQAGRVNVGGLTLYAGLRVSDFRKTFFVSDQGTNRGPPWRFFFRRRWRSNRHHGFIRRR